ncbi:MAG: hypothetical protein LBU23_05040 [Planctomycetota bacterium]|jgi:hypothetical protein|nr:hypothetical protein [Planctomycetota bacterium]
MTVNVNQGISSSVSLFTPLLDRSGPAEETSVQPRGFQAVQLGLQGDLPLPPPQPQNIGPVAVTVDPQVNPQAVLIARQNVHDAPPAPGQVAVTIPGLGPKNISLTMVPKGLRGQPDIGERLREKIIRGGESFRNISSGAIPDYMKPGFAGLLSIEQQRAKAMMISDLAFFLQAQGEAKYGPFSEGAFSLPDPNGNLLKFLTSYPASYQRPSSHLDGLKAGGQTGTRTDPGVEHWGLDLHDDGAHLDTVLPNGFGTILFGKMPAVALSSQVQDHPGMGEIREDRLFLKIETHGTGGGVDRALHNPPGQTRGIMQRIGDFFSHAGGYIKSLCRRLFGNNNPPGSHKERIPPQMKADYKAIVKLVSRAAGSKTDKDVAKAIIGARHCTGDSQGLRTMLLNLSLLELDAPDVLRHEANAGLRDAINNFRVAWSAEHGFDHPELRIGQEIILTDVELQGDAPV